MMLTKYIPTETVTLFVAVVGAISSIDEGSRRPYLLGAYWFFAILTPVFVVLVAYRSYLKPTADAKRLTTGFTLPVFRMVAAFVAFLVWGLAVPNIAAVFTIEGTLVQILSGVGALIVSTILTMLEPIFEKRKS